MTCIIGLVDKDTVYIGGDSGSVDVNNFIIRKSNVPKVFKKGPFLIGYTTSFRMGQLLEHCLKVPVRQSYQSNQKYMVKEFIESVRVVFKEKGYSTINNNNEIGGTFLVGYRGCLYTIYSDFQIAEVADGLDTIGCGDQLALGAMAALSKLKPKQRIRKSLEIVSKFSSGVCAPFRILSIS